MAKPPESGRGAGRKALTQRIKKTKLKESSRRWLERHINDPYVQRSRAEGYRSRAVYKLLEIDEKHHILKGARRIIDLGAAPGGWSQIAARSRHLRHGGTDNRTSADRPYPHHASLRGGGAFCH